MGVFPSGAACCAWYGGSGLVLFFRFIFLFVFPTVRNDHDDDGCIGGNEIVPS